METKGSPLRSVFGAKYQEPRWSLLDARALAGRRVEFWRIQLVRATLLYADIVLALVVWWVAALIRNILAAGALSESTVAVILPGMLGWLALRYAAGLYPGYALSAVEELRRQVYTVLTAASVAIVFAFFLQIGGVVSRLVLFLGFAGILILGPLVRYGTKWVLMRSGLWGKPVVIIGSGEGGGGLVRTLNEEWGLGLRPAALFEGFEGDSGDRELSEAVELARKHGVDTVMLAMPRDDRERLLRISNLASYSFRRVIVIPDLEGVINSAVAVRDFSGNFGVEIKHNLLDPSIRRMKRVLDLALACLVGVVALPVLAVLTLLVLVDSGRPVFYNDRRMGKDGKVFACMKFRTMVPDAETVLQECLREDPALREEYVRYHKLRNDPRITKIGRFLRKTSLDELPQLWNVLRGEMSLVGPRPYLPRESTDIGIAQGEILRVPPGVTGLWQVRGRNSTTFDDRVELDTYYVRNWSLWIDLIILTRTAGNLFSDRNAW